MSDELVEALARRMSHVSHANPRYPDVVYDMDWELYVDAARECLRQMEWSRIGAFTIHDPVTPAPPDWKP